MLIRTIVAIIYIAIFLPALYFGNLSLTLVLMFISATSALEFSRLAKFDGNGPLRTLCVLGSLAFILDAWLFDGIYSGAILTAVVVLACFSQVVSGSTYRSTENISSTVLGVILCGWTFSRYYLIRSGFPDMALAFMTVGIIWSDDVGAYIVGSLFGHRKLAPNISPNKTVAGSIGGIAFAVVFVTAFKMVGDYLGYWTTLGWPLIIMCALALAVVGQLGDLAESAIKREAKVKDSGNILPGHGGMLDRFDSFAMVAPVAYYIYLFLARL